MHHSTWRTNLRLERLMIFLDLCRTMYPLWLLVLLRCMAQWTVEWWEYRGTHLYNVYRIHILVGNMPLHIPQLFLEEPETYLAGAFLFLLYAQEKMSLGIGQYTPIFAQISLVAVSLSKCLVLSSYMWFDNTVNWSEDSCLPSACSKVCTLGSQLFPVTTSALSCAMCNCLWILNCCVQYFSVKLLPDMKASSFKTDQKVRELQV